MPCLSVTYRKSTFNCWKYVYLERFRWQYDRTRCRRIGSIMAVEEELPSSSRKGSGSRLFRSLLKMPQDDGDRCLWSGIVRNLSVVDEVGECCKTRSDCRGEEKRGEEKERERDRAGQVVSHAMDFVCVRLDLPSWLVRIYCSCQREVTTPLQIGPAHSPHITQTHSTWDPHTHTQTYWQHERNQSALLKAFV